MSDSPGWTRRKFLESIGAIGGAAAVYDVMTAMGILGVPEAYAGPPNDGAAFGKGRKVAILGAGVAGLTAALVFKRNGFDVTILEAQGRSGGRNLTVRRNDQIKERGRDPQTCMYDAGQYLNAGPGRIPYHHTAVLDYCKELDVKLEPYIMSTRANLQQTPRGFGGKPQVNRAIANDTRGWVSELLAKAINKKALDDELNEGQKKELLDLLDSFGDLDNKPAGLRQQLIEAGKPRPYKYLGSSRSGYTVQPAIVTPGDIVDPIPRNTLLTARFWEDMFYQPEDYLWQPTLFQPVGGMDHIVTGFLDALTKLHVKPLTSREVVLIENSANGVIITHQATGGSGSSVAKEEFDWCISTIPLPILKRIEKRGFNDAYVGSIGLVPFESTCKVGWQANSRFWETEDEIYGGISYIRHNITQMWYPSAGFFGGKGVLTGAYNYLGKADTMAALSFHARLVLAMEGAKLLHPDFDKHVPLDMGLSIAWKNIPFQEGGWAMWDGIPGVDYHRLLHADKRFLIAGDQMSFLPGWQEGAIRSAHFVYGEVANSIKGRTMLMKVDESTLVAPSTSESIRGTTSPD
ncbi:MAG: hypothetical protein JWN02_555 [Acidobacteria bacterium]|nr:hypothetical protein [Acidobacteriota bacterium]